MSSRSAEHYQAGRCSLCGGRATIWHQSAPGFRIVYVECTRCHCRGPEVQFNLDPAALPHIEAEEIAVAKWNRLHYGG